MMRRTLLGRIRNQMMVHTQAVEEILYPALRNYMTTEGHSRLDDAYREHHQIRDLLNDLQGTDPLTDTFDQKLAQLKIRMERRLADEEVEMFPMLVERMSRDQQHEIGRRIRDRKKDLRMRIAA
jgi:iron-sulfur cluster repair protein YtfE (RIC family)